MQSLPKSVRHLRASLALVGALYAGCGHAIDLDRTFADTDSRIRDVLRAGAYACAPRELAVARAHLEFARVDYMQGDQEGAGDHLRESSLNVHAAERLSPSERCASPSSERGPGLQISDGPDADLDGVDDAHDRCPGDHEDSDGYLDEDGCVDADNDQDSIADESDACPNQPGGAGGDGCPVQDQDGDGIADNLDRCPEELGTVVDQGCPRLKYESLEVTPRALRLIQPVLFETGTPIIRSVSFGVLNTVVLALREHPKITIEVQAHTDSLGDDGKNMELSQEQARSVVAYLVQNGIDPVRLTSHGYGETRPIESNQTSQGRNINRRVEFVRADKAP